MPRLSPSSTLFPYTTLFRSLLRCIALAGGVTLDRADGNAGIGHAPQFRPSGQRGHEPAIDMRRIGSGVATHLLEPNRGDRSRQAVDLGEPVGEAQVAHAAAVITAGPEARSSAGDQPFGRAQRPAGAGAEIQRENAG